MIKLTTKMHKKNSLENTAYQNDEEIENQNSQ